MKESTTYTPPKVWKWDQDEENRFSKINRPIAGQTHDKDLPVGSTRYRSTLSPHPMA